MVMLVLACHTVDMNALELASKGVNIGQDLRLGKSSSIFVLVLIFIIIAGLGN
jgi:hypothetical protein